jgi:hypothetical protein
MVGEWDSGSGFKVLGSPFFVLGSDVDVRN